MYIVKSQLLLSVLSNFLVTNGKPRAANEHGLLPANKRFESLVQANGRFVS